jgi:hypothetical protein
VQASNGKDYAALKRNFQREGLTEGERENNRAFAVSNRGGPHLSLHIGPAGGFGFETTLLFGVAEEKEYARHDVDVRFTFSHFKLHFITWHIILNPDGRVFHMAHHISDGRVFHSVAGACKGALKCERQACASAPCQDWWISKLTRNWTVTVRNNKIDTELLMTDPPRDTLYITSLGRIDDWPSQRDTSYITSLDRIDD